jgi:transposase-like protein
MKKTKISEETKFKAVGEVLLATGTLDLISEKYGMSPSYLSTLTSRAKRAVVKTTSTLDGEVVAQSKRENMLVSLLTEKAGEIENVRKEIERIGGEMRQYMPDV